jgi:hypothetical protein
MDEVNADGQDKNMPYFGNNERHTLDSRLLNSNNYEDYCLALD